MDRHATVFSEGLQATWPKRVKRHVIVFDSAKEAQRALARLGRKHGYRIEEYFEQHAALRPDEPLSRNDLMESALVLFHSKGRQVAIDYLLKRGISGELAEYALVGKQRARKYNGG